MRKYIWRSEGKIYTSNIFLFSLMSHWVTFITGNPQKAEYLRRYLEIDLQYRALDLDEIQSLDLREVVEKKAREAYRIIQSPVLVEDVSVEITHLGRLPWPFIKYFMQEIGDLGITRLVDGKNRTAVARCGFWYFDGETFVYFSWSLSGTISESPRGTGGFWWDRIFIPDGYAITRAEMDASDDATTYLQIKPLQAVRDFLLSSS